MGERPFKVNLLVQIDAYGLPEIHRRDIIARVKREMELMFRGEAHVQEVENGPLANGGGNHIWLQPSEVVEEQMHGVGEKAQVPQVRNSTPSTGTGLRSIPNHMLGVRLPIPRQAPNGGSS